MAAACSRIISPNCGPSYSADSSYWWFCCSRTGSSGSFEKGKVSCASVNPLREHRLCQMGKRLCRRGSVEMNDRSIIQLEGVTVDYDGFKALNNLNFIVDYNELRVVIGPNGAGKTTLLDVICGKTKPASGRVFFGKDTDLKGKR